MSVHGLPALLELGPGVEERHLVDLPVEATDEPGPYAVRLRCVAENTKVNGGGKGLSKAS